MDCPLSAKTIESHRQSDALDTMLLTHLHGDHVGEVAESSPQSKRGDYRFTGAADVAEVFPIGAVIDRGWPDYGYPVAAERCDCAELYRAVQELARRGTNVNQALAGSASQLSLRRRPDDYSSF